MLNYLHELYPNLCKLVNLNKKDVLSITQSSFNVYIIISGVIQVGKLNLENKITTLALLNNKHYYVLLSNDEYHIKSLTTSSILVIKIVNLSFLITKIPKLLPLILNGIHKYQLLSEEFSLIYQYKTTSRKIVGLLLFLIKYFGNNIPQGIRISIRVSQTDMAQMLSSTRVSINRNLRILQKIKSIQIMKGKIIIINPIYFIQMNQGNISSYF